MKIYKLRDKDTGHFYKGSGYFDQKGHSYTSKGHIKNSLKQSWGKKLVEVLHFRNLEIITYNVIEESVEDFKV